MISYGLFLRYGEVAERSKAAVLKTVVEVTPPGVRIPASPPKFASMRTLANFGEISPKAKGFWRIRHTETNMYHVYILLNKAKTRTYTGVAEDVNERLAVHNAGRVKSSSPHRPYEIIHTESFETLIEARQRERFYKSTTGRRRIKEMFFSHQLH